MERTLVLVKPDGVRRGLVGRVISRFEARGLKIAAIKMLRLNAAAAAEHYAEHADKPFYDELIDFMISGPIVAMVLEGTEVIRIARELIGPAFVADRRRGTIRGDFSVSAHENVVHSSTDDATAGVEIKRFFADGERVWDE